MLRNSIILPWSNNLDGIVDIVLLLNDREISDAQGKLKIPGERVVIELLSKLISIRVAVVKLKARGGTIFIRLLLK